MKEYVMENTKIIDAISINANGKVELTISDDLIWDSENHHLEILQDKINTYIEFLETGNIYEKYPKAVGRQFIIQVAMKHHPSNDGIEFLIRVGAILHDSGYDFGYYIVKNKAS